MLFTGFLIIITGHMLMHGWREAIIVPMGGLLIAIAHFVNYRYSGSCTTPHSKFHVSHPGVEHY